MTADEVRQLPPTLPPEKAFELIGCGRTAGYQSLRDGTFPVPAFRVGGRWYVPTAPLLKLLELEDDERPGT